MYIKKKLIVIWQVSVLILAKNENLKWYINIHKFFLINNYLKIYNLLEFTYSLSQCVWFCILGWNWHHFINEWKETKKIYICIYPRRKRKIAFYSIGSLPVKKCGRCKYSIIKVSNCLRRLSSLWPKRSAIS